MSDAIRFTARMTSETTRVVDFEIDGDEFAKWSGNAAPTGANVKEFIQSGRDREEIEDAMWDLGNEVVSSSSGFVDIESISIIESEH